MGKKGGRPHEFWILLNRKITDHCSNLRKVSILLQAFDRAEKDIDYYALDLSQPELERTLSAVDGIYKYVRCHGLFGTYDDGLAWLKTTANMGKPKCILWMGSSIGNLDRTEAADFLKNCFSEVLRGQDSMLIGIDACQESDKIYHAYNDKQGKTHEFILNGLIHANKLMGKEVFRQGDWKVVGQYDEEAGRHQAFYSPVRDVLVEGTLIRTGERIRVEESYKYSILQSNELWQRAGLMVQARFGNRTNEYRKLAYYYAPSFLASCPAPIAYCRIHICLPSTPRPMRSAVAINGRFHIIPSSHATFPRLRGIAKTNTKTVSR